MQMQQYALIGVRAPVARLDRLQGDIRDAVAACDGCGRRRRVDGDCVEEMYDEFGRRGDFDEVDAVEGRGVRYGDQAVLRAHSAIPPGLVSVALIASRSV